MEKAKEILNKIFLSSKAKTFYWQTVNGFIVVVMASIADMDWQYIPILYAVLNGATKHINKTYLS